jgi:hypothetical protein
MLLAEWAIEPLVRNRGDRPWSAIRALLLQSAPPAEPLLHKLALALTTDPLDSRQILQALIGSTADQTSLSQACVHAWLISAVLEVVTPYVSSDDSGLALVIQRRAAIIDRLCVELTDDSFDGWDPGEFNPEQQAAMWMPERLTLFEALLLDLGIGPEQPQDEWLRSSEAAALYQDRVRSRAKRDAMVVAVLAPFPALVLILALALGLPRGLLLGFGVLFACLLLPTQMWPPSAGESDVRDDIGIFLLVGSLCVFAAGINMLLPQPVIGDAGGLVLSAVIPLGAAILWHYVGRRRFRRG